MSQFNQWLIGIILLAAIAHTCFDVYRALRGLWVDDEKPTGDTRDATDVNLVSSGFEEIMNTELQDKKNERHEQ